MAKQTASSKAKPTANRKPKVVVKKKADNVVDFKLPTNATRSFTLGMVIEQDVLAGKTSVVREELVRRADVIYSKAHGKAANPTEAKWSSNQGIGAMRGLGLVEVSTDTVFFNPALIQLIKARKKNK